MKIWRDSDGLPSRLRLYFIFVLATVGSGVDLDWQISNHGFSPAVIAGLVVAGLVGLAMVIRLIQIWDRQLSSKELRKSRSAYKSATSGARFQAYVGIGILIAGAASFLPGAQTFLQAFSPAVMLIGGPVAFAIVAGNKNIWQRR